ncbi:MAG: hypothetical protein IK143_02125 [Bacteroidales bacterium]|nr:hypothetical protein [Bacteroidales bacterium]
MKKILILASALLLAGSCAPDKYPPKTDSSDDAYVLPQGEIPSEEELAVVAAIRERYNTELNP